MDDLISRQAAIDAVDGVDWYHQNKNGEMVHGANSDEHQAWYKAEDIYHVLDTLPSAQPAEDIHREKEQAYYCGYEDGAKAARSAQPGWIPCTPETMPEREEKVLITCEHLDIYGKPHRYVCKAFYVDRYTMRSDVDWWDEGCDEYREEDDQYYVLEGWYEYIHNWGDYSSVRITEDKVVAWCELPKPWEGEKP